MISSKAKEPVLYIIFGVLTTVVNLAVYHACLWLGMAYGLANTLAFIVAILFAYVTNKTLVFESRQAHVRGLLTEFFKFMMARLGTFAVEMIGLWLMIDLLGFGDMLPKYLLTVLVIVLNYFLSKWVVFKVK